VDEPTALPLATLLSLALVAFTIELDNTFEQRAPHTTERLKRDGRGDGPWLTSFVMYANFTRLVAEDGSPLAALRGAAGITNLHGLQRWGHIRVDEGVVRMTSRGAQVRAVWIPLAAEIEARWVDRFGAATIAALRAALDVAADDPPRELPAFLPVVSADLRTRLPKDVGDAGPDGLLSRLARVLLAFTLDFERDFPLALPVCANLLRVLGNGAIPVRDLPSLTGVSKEAARWALGILVRGGLAVSEPSARARGQSVRLTERGLSAKSGYGRHLAATEAQWRARFGGATIDSLKLGLAEISPRLAEGTVAPSTGWRARLRRPLPHHPMVLHRGGYPDGA
jgi:hypothetical protein